MVPGRELTANGTEVDSHEGSVSLKSPEESLPEPAPVFGGNASAPDLISSQPGSVPAEKVQKPQRPRCPRCGLLHAPASRDPRGPRGSSLSVHTTASSRRSKGSVATLNQPAATPGDSCLELLLACLFCHCSVLVLGLLGSCSSCLASLCSCCGPGCTSCCSAVQDVPMEELNCHAHCHSVLFESCCEPTECLEFCLECCQICHRS